MSDIWAYSLDSFAHESKRNTRRQLLRCHKINFFSMTYSL